MNFKVIIDTNILISGIFWAGMPGEILEAWKEGKFEVVVSEEILDEYNKKLKEKSIKLGKEEEVNEWIDIIKERAIEVKKDIDLKLCRDKTDNIFLEISATGKVKYLVTRDDDLKRDLELINKMKRDYQVEIVSIKQFLQILKNKVRSF